MLFIFDEVGEVGGVLEREFEWFERVVETQDSNRAGELSSGAQKSERVSGGAQANVPDDEFAGVICQAFDDSELADVKGLGFCNGANNRMKRFSVRERMDAVRASGEFYETIAGGR
jgi:hypothetical protein